MVLRNKIEYLGNKLIIKLDLMNSGNTDIELERKFGEDNVSKSKIYFIILSIFMTLLILANLIIMIFTSSETTSNRIILFIISILFLSAFVILLLIGSCKKSLCTLFVCEILFVMTLYVLFISIICYILIWADGDIQSNVYLSIQKRLFFYFNMIYFSLNLFFNFSLARVVIVNIVMGLTLFLTYYFIQKSEIINEVLYLLTSSILFEICGYLKFKYSRQLFFEKLQNEMVTNYFLEILHQMNAGFGIVKSDEIVFANGKFNEFLNIYLQTQNSNNFSIKSFVEKFGQGQENKVNEIEECGKKISFAYEKIQTTECSEKNENILKSHSFVNFNKLGIFTFYTPECEKKYEIFISKHKYYTTDLTEIIVNDLTDSFAKLQMKEDFRVKSNLIAKISHEFTTPLISIKETIKEIKKHTNKTPKLVDKFKKVKFLSKYLFVLVKELTFYVNFENEVEFKNKKMQEVNFFKMLSKIKKIIYHVKELNQMKNNSLVIETNLKTIQDQSISKGINLENTDTLIKIISDYDLLYHFIINLFLILLKVINHCVILVTVDITEFEIKKSNKIKIKISSDYHSKLDGFAFFGYENLMKQDYSKVQGVDVSYFICSRLSKELNLDLLSKQNNNQICISFNLNCETLIQNDGLINETKAHIHKDSSFVSNFSTQTIKLSEIDLLKSIKQIDLLKHKFSSKLTQPEILINNFNLKQYFQINSFDNLKADNRQSKTILKRPIKRKSQTTINGQNRSNNFILSSKHIKLSSSPNDDSSSKSNNSIDSIKKLKISPIKKERSNKFIFGNNHLSINVNGFSNNEDIYFKQNKQYIFIADDVNDIRKSIKNLVISIYKKNINKIEIIECSDGIEVVYNIYKLYQDNKVNFINCIITDQFMNFLNGTDIANILNKLVNDNKINKIPLIFCTAFQDNINISDIMSNKPDKILNKPVSKSCLIQAFEECNILII